MDPQVDVLKGSGLTLDDGVVVNEYLETDVADVYAAGDVAQYYDPIFEKRRRVEHWDNAVQQGKHAADVMTGRREPFQTVPYFFSDVFDLSWEFWGDVQGAEEVAYRGELGDGSFSVWWTKGDAVVAAFVMDRPEEERELAPKWIKNAHEVSLARLEDEARSLA